MKLLAVIIICFVAVVITLVALRKRLLNKATNFQKSLNAIPPFKPECKIEAADISAVLEESYINKIICTREKNGFINHYKAYYLKAIDLIKTLKPFKLSPSPSIIAFINDYENINTLVNRHNEIVTNGILEKHKDFFDNCLKYPLDKQQRRSIVSEEDNCLVVSSAGSGKTSSIIGKVKYLTEIKHVSSGKILLISYTNKAAAELTERIATPGLKGYTFHKLAIDIIAKATGEKPSICDNTDSLFVNIYRNLLEESSFKKNVVEYFIQYSGNETQQEEQEREEREKLSVKKKPQLKAMFPDMDGKTILVRSKQEQTLCDILASFGIKFRYEEPYEHQLADEMHSQYRPDFSIYFEEDGLVKRIYLEHFGVDEHSLVPGWFAKEKNISYEEANQLYNDGITWKRAAHEKFGTKLLVTSSADFQHSDIREKLKELLDAAGVPIQEKSEEELYDLILPKGSKQEKAFIRLLSTFVTLAKSSCKSFDEIIRQAKIANDKRSKFIIKKIFFPVYEKYSEELRSRNQIDFTDAILRATDLYPLSNAPGYEYIIVDEFQDISIDRYNFLKALRNGPHPSKLYCVGDDWQSIYRFSGSDMALFNQFPDFFGPTEVKKIETTYRFGEPLISLSSRFIQRNSAQIKKDIRAFSSNIKTELEFLSYDKYDYCSIILKILSSIPSDKSIFLLGRYSFDDYFLSHKFKGMKEGNQFYYLIGDRKIEFLTVHKSKGLEADYVILLQCNKDTYGFPSQINDHEALNYVLTQSDQFPYGEERRLFYVAITRAKMKTFVLYDKRSPSVFVDEILHPEEVSPDSYAKHPNSNKKWTPAAERYLLSLYNEGKSIKYIAQKWGEVRQLSSCD